MQNTILIALALAGAAVQPLCAQEIVGTRDARARRADSIFAAFDHTDTPGCALGVYQQGGIQYARGYGMASLELGVPITPRTVFDVGSVSKEFTAMSILILAKEGKLSIDDPVRKYVPELPAYADRITLRELLSHTSGIRDHFGLMSVAGMSFEGTADTLDDLRLITHSAEPNFEPGTRYLYSNSGFVLLAQIVYRVTGEPLARFAAEHIFTPLGMRATRFKDDHDAIIPGRAEAYAPRGDGFRDQMSQFDMAGEGGLHTSVVDFAQWAHNFDDPVVGGREIVDAMRTPTRLRNDSILQAGPGSSYGLGLTVGRYRGLRWFGHDGVWAGYRAAFMAFPDQQLTVATLCNVTNAGPDSLVRAVAAIYLAHEMGPDSTAAWRVALEGEPREALSPAALHPFEGVWRNVQLGEVRRTTAMGDSLFVQPGRRVPLVPLGDRRFRLAPASEVLFEGDSAGAPTRLVTRAAGGTPVVFLRAPEVSLSAARLAEYAGSYYTPEVEVTDTLRVEGSRLVMQRNGRRVMTLEPTYPDGFVSVPAGPGGGGGGGTVIDFVRDRSGHITGFLMEAGRVRHLRFVKAK